MTIPWLADELRAADLRVIEHSGWKTHVVSGAWNPRFGVVHATAAPRTQSDATQVQIVRNGRVGLTGPIALACVDRTGVWHVLSAGRCNTTLVGTAGPFKGLGNANALGVEACNDNGLDDPAESWPMVQYRSYYTGWGVICRKLGWTKDNLVGHKEHTPGHKTDPTFSMSQFRADVARVLIRGGDMELTNKLSAKGSPYDGYTINNTLVTILTRLPTDLGGLRAAVQTTVTQLGTRLEQKMMELEQSPDSPMDEATRLALIAAFREITTSAVKEIEAPTADEIAQRVIDKIAD